MFYDDISFDNMKIKTYEQIRLHIFNLNDRLKYCKWLRKNFRFKTGRTSQEYKAIRHR